MQDLTSKMIAYVNASLIYEGHLESTHQLDLTEEEFKENLANRSAAERQIWGISESLFGSRKFENEPDYEKRYLLPILQRFENSNEYIEANVAPLRDFANSLSELQIYENVAVIPDRPVALVIYKALFNNAMRGNNREEQITLARDFAMVLNTAGYEMHEKAVKILEQLFQRIPEEEFGRLSPEAREAYGWCKYVWAVSHFDDPNCHFSKLNSALNSADEFYGKAIAIEPQNPQWETFAGMVRELRKEIGKFCEFGKNAAYDLKYAEEHFGYLQNNMRPPALKALANVQTRHRYIHENLRPAINGKKYISWAALANKTNRLLDREYWQTLTQMAKITFAHIRGEESHVMQGKYLETGITATAILCKYYNQMGEARQASVRRLAKQCLNWMRTFPVKYRAMFGHLGIEINRIRRVAAKEFEKHEDSELLLKLTTESTYAHSYLCGEMAVDLAKTLMKTHPVIFAEIFPKMNKKDILKEIAIGVRLHDIGKLEVSIPTSQTLRAIFEEEFGLIKSHPQRAVKYLSSSRFDCARACAIWHHTHFDGRGGYPSDPPCIDETAEKFRFIAQLCTFVDCYTSAIDRYKSAYQVEKKPMDLIAELEALSKPEKYEGRPFKAEGRKYYNPLFSEALVHDSELYAKYTSEEYVKRWIDKAYYKAYTAFQPEFKITSSIRQRLAIKKGTSQTQPLLSEVAEIIKKV